MQKKCLNKNNERGVFPSFFLTLFISVLILFLLFDNGKLPEKQIMVRITVTTLNFYKTNISKPAAEKHNIRVCRFNPSCSMYAKQAFLKHGFFKGFYFSTIRVLKCNPFYGEPIMEDNVP